MRSLALAVGMAVATPGGVAACGGAQTEDVSYTEAAERAYAEAERAFDRKDYELARLKFTELHQRYPYSTFAALAEFRVGDTHLRERSYPQAIEAFRRFARIRPAHALVPEAQYKIALAYVEQMPRELFIRPPSYERDLTDVQNAHRALETFLSSYPDSELAGDARARLEQTTARLASYELYAAEFYAREDNPRAAALRCAYLIDHYPDAPQVPEAQFLYARALILLGDARAGAALLRTLSAEHPDHPLAVEAAAWLARNPA